MNKDEILRELQDIDRTLERHNVENDHLKVFMRDFDEYPSGEVISQFNELVAEYQNTTAYKQKIAITEELIDFYNAHAEDLAFKKPEIDKLKDAHEDMILVERAMERVIDLLDEGGY